MLFQTVVAIDYEHSILPWLANDMLHIIYLCGNFKFFNLFRLKYKHVVITLDIRFYLIFYETVRNDRVTPISRNPSVVYSMLSNPHSILHRFD